MNNFHNLRTCFVGQVLKERNDLLEVKSFLSYDVAVIQWITSCHKMI